MRNDGRPLGPDSREGSDVPAADLVASLPAFPCTSCGACCRLVYGNSWFRLHDFVLPDGSCKHLQPDNTCGIYETRPELCRINGIYEGSGLVNIVPVRVFHDFVITSCCWGAVRIAGLDPSKVPARNYESAVMSRALETYFESLGGEFSRPMPPLSQIVPIPSAAEVAEKLGAGPAVFRVPE